jgi:adenine-specific DNA-methyltransferase
MLTWKRRPFAGRFVGPVPAAPDQYRSATLPGLARAFRRWAASLSAQTVEVAGATSGERHRLAALGGVARVVADDVPRHWPAAVRSWALAGPEPPGSIVDAVLSALARDEDPLGALYNASISAANRRRLGTVFTPPALVEHLFQLVEGELGTETPATVIDPGAGVGAFTVAAARTWPDAQIIASDINPVTLGLLGARLASEADLDEEYAEVYRRVSLRLGDYLDQLDRVFSESARGPVLALGNPPYTRIQELPLADREKAAHLAGDLIDSGHANLAMLFQAATLRHMRDEDVSCLVVPGSFSYTRASRSLRSALWQSSRSVVVHRTPATSKVFAGRSVQAAVLLVGRKRERRDALRLARIQLGSEHVEVIERWSSPRSGDEPDNWFWVPSVDDTTAAVALGDIATVRRGTATGANEMFFMTDDVMETLPPDVVVRGMPTLRGFEADDLTPEAHASFEGAKGRRWLLAIPPGFELNGTLKRYVDEHEATVSGRYLPRQRPCWYVITELPRPQILISPLAKRTFKIVLNSAAAVPSNNLFGITLTGDGDPRNLAKWLRSNEGQAELRRLSRRYPGGSYKIEPRRLQAVRVPLDVIESANREESASDGSVEPVTVRADRSS